MSKEFKVQILVDDCERDGVDLYFDNEVKAYEFSRGFNMAVKYVTDREGSFVENVSSDLLVYASRGGKFAYLFHRYLRTNGVRHTVTQAYPYFPNGKIVTKTVADRLKFRYSGI